MDNISGGESGFLEALDRLPADLQKAALAYMAYADAVWALCDAEALALEERDRRGETILPERE